MEPCFAVTVTLMAEVTAFVATLKVTELDPAGTVTDLGTVAFVEPEERATDIPEPAAIPLSETVPIALFPPTRLGGETLIDESEAGFRVSFADGLAVPYVAVIVTDSVLATPLDETTNVVELEPAGTTTELGTDASLLPELKVTAIPLLGAGPFSVTVPTAEVPPAMLVGAIETPVRVGGTTVKAPVAVVVSRVAEILTEVDPLTEDVVTGNVALTEFAGMKTDPGTDAVEELDAKVTVIPPAGAGVSSDTVPVVVAPPTTGFGLSVTV
jgi:hypothetical protein